MQLSDFHLVERGPSLFDAWESHERIASPIGDFKIEFQVEMGSSPTAAMLEVAEQLLARFNSDKGVLAQRVYDKYLSVCSDPEGVEWMADCGVPVGLSMADVSRHLNPRTLTVDAELNMSVYTSPDWDREHGLYFDLVDGDWLASD